MPKKLFAFLLVFILAGCGTLRVDVDFGTTPGAGGSSPTATPTSIPVFPPDTPTTAAAGPEAPTLEPTATETAPPPLRATAVAAGKAHTCVVTNAGGVKCWGKNEHRQLGNGTMVNSDLPVDVAGLSGVKAGAVACWGYNQNGELGNGMTGDSGVPVGVSGLGSGVVSIEAGDDHTCAVTDQGEVKCWGYNRFGQLGDGSTTSRNIPVTVKGLPGGALAVAAGWGHTCALTADQSVKCWGDDEYGQLGYGQMEDYRFTPMDLAGLERSVVRISADGGQTCALTIYGGVSCWGNNRYGQLGDGTAEVRNSPVQVTGLTEDVAYIAAGWNHTCALVAGRGMQCWGWNYYGQLGDGTKASRTVPGPVYGLSESIDAIGVGWGHTCVVTGTGGVKCWGLNNSGQLGDGTTIDSQVPLVVVGLAGAQAFSPTLERQPTSTATAAITETPTPTSQIKFTRTPTKTM
jgi:alpha-tubulin suppressor-like RCC1 family protein